MKTKIKSRLSGYKANKFNLQRIKWTSFLRAIAIQVLTVDCTVHWAKQKVSQKNKSSLFPLFLLMIEPMYIAALKSKLQKNIQQSLYYNKYLVLKNYTKYMLMIILKWFMLGLAEKTNLRTSFFLYSVQFLFPRENRIYYLFYKWVYCILGYWVSTFFYK